LLRHINDHHQSCTSLTRIITRLVAAYDASNVMHASKLFDTFYYLGVACMPLQDNKRYGNPVGNIFAWAKRCSSIKY
jgi:hypothetical protein